MSEKRGRKKIELTAEQINKAIKEYKYFGQAAKFLGVSYPTFLREKERLGLGSTMDNNTELEPKLELEEWNNLDEYISAMEKTDEICTEKIGYDDVHISINERCIIIPWGDWHVGGAHTRHGQLGRDVKYIKEHSNIYVVMMGDYCDNFLKTGHGGGVYEQALNVSRQKQRVEYAVRSLNDRILGIVMGCHDKWMFDNEGFDFAQYLAKKCKGSWMGLHALIHLTIGSQKYEIFASHKYQRWSRDNPTHGLIDVFRNMKNFEIAFGGHRHQPAISQTWLRDQWITCVRNSSYKVTDYFIAHKNLPDSPYYLPCVILDSDEHSVTVFRDLREAVKFL